jgi:hypothetical protein
MKKKDVADTWVKLDRQLINSDVRWYDRAGKPIDALKWSILHDDRDYVVIDREVATMKPLAEVSTVWLGLNHNWDPDGEPLIFESMVFGGPENGMLERYATEAEAREGHIKMIAKLRAGGDDE